MVLLISIGIIYVVNDYTIDNVSDQMIVDNHRIFDYIEIMSEKADGQLTASGFIAKKFVDRVNTPAIKRRLNFMHFVVMESDTKDLYFNSIFDETKEEYVLDQLNYIEDLGISQGNFFDKPMIVYKEQRQLVAFGEQKIVTVYTMVYNEILRKVMYPLAIILIIVVLIGIVMSLVITRRLGSNITKPIDELIQMSENIAKKESVEGIRINSNDEFQKLGLALQSMASILEEKDKSQKQMYEQLSHDFKTPLTVISGYAEGVMGDIFEDDDKALTTIVDECKSLRSQVENVIFLSQLDDVREFYNLEELDLAEVVGSSINRFLAVFAVQNIDVDYEPLKAYPTLIDRDKIDRMLDNIFSNCLRYAKEQISVLIHEEENAIILTIDDDGGGFSDSILSNPFETNRGATKEGNGLGLLITRKIIEGHSGQLELSNTLIGARYTIKFEQTCHD